jgi:hypothetical protein
MLVPRHPNSTPQRPLFLALACLLFLASVPLHAVRGPAPPQRILLEDLGFQPLSQQFLLNGSSMLTLHYVDDQHILITFTVRRLMRRLSDDPPDDLDRSVDAVLLELPTGKILARTTWRLHDHGQYLWNLGHGHFLLRVRDTLTTFAPLANLSTPEPFAERPFLFTEDRVIASIIVSPDDDLLLVQTRKRSLRTAKPTGFALSDPQPLDSDPAPVQINFYRLSLQNDNVQPAFAGVVHARSVGMIAATTAGYLATIDQGKQHYAFDFHSYSGRVDELAPLDSTCPPAPLFVSHSEFIAFACRSGQNLQTVGGFNMRGQEMWEQNLYGDYMAPSLVYAPAGGRFAFSRVLTRGGSGPVQIVGSDDVGAQTVIVYQIETGKQILHADCSPIERAGQNFALSPNGLALAVVHADAIEIYTLPPLTSKDQADIKLAEASAPPPSDLPVHFDDQPESPAQADSSTQPAPTNANPPSTTSTAPPATVSEDPAGNRTNLNPPAAEPAPPTPAANQASGDALPEQPRKPPTLYTLPTDKVPASDTPRNQPTPQ